MGRDEEEAMLLGPEKAGDGPRDITDETSEGNLCCSGVYPTGMSDGGEGLFCRGRAVLERR